MSFNQNKRNWVNLIEDLIFYFNEYYNESLSSVAKWELIAFLLKYLYSDASES